MHFAELTKPSEGPFVFVMCVTPIALPRGRPRDAQPASDPDRIAPAAPAPR